MFGDRLRRSTHWLILGATWCGFLVYAFPGYMSYDSGVQLSEARSGTFSDWHPPVMAELWRIVDWLFAGPFGMLVIQSTTFLIGLYLIATTRFSRVRAALLASAILSFPPAGTVMAVIWKDSQMLGYLVLGIALLLRPARRTQIAGLVLLALATAMRHNALTITPAIVIPLFRWSDGLSRTRRYAIASAAWLALTGTAELANHVLTDQEAHLWHESLALYDIAGTLRYAGGMTEAEALDLVGKAVAPGVTRPRSRAKDVYDPSQGYFSVINNELLVMPHTDEERRAVEHAWRNAVFARPGAYLHHRWATFVELIELDERDRQAVWVGYDPYSPYQHRPNAVQHVLQKGALAIGASWLVRPCLYLLALVCMVPFAIRRRDVLSGGLIVSALISEAALLVLAPTPDFRYSIWAILCSLLVPVLLVGQGRASRRKMLPSTSPR